MGRIVLGPARFTSTREHTARMKSLRELDDQGEPVQTHADAAEKAAAARQVPDEDKKATEWVEEVNAAQTQAQLDNVAQRYSDSGRDFKTVEDAIEKKQAELDGDDD